MQRKQRHHILGNIGYLEIYAHTIEPIIYAWSSFFSGVTRIPRKFPHPSLGPVFFVYFKAFGISMQNEFDHQINYLYFMKEESFYLAFT
jgi:hypothetical protein